jgi:NADH:ubiquinone oxidoreductase subunit 5 (subunit L)/multisubunit Na+/H+ antiporter MnhA subunit
LWEGSIEVRIAVAVVGLVTAIVASSIARVQSSIKTQIAYASITQIGLMFIELAAGLQWLVLLHFVSNASLRAYQLLISPSVVGYLVHDQFFYFVPPVQKIKDTFLGKLRASFYVLGIKEWSMNTAVSHYLWKPLKIIGRAFAFLDKSAAQVMSAVFFLTCLIAVLFLELSSTSMLIIATISACISTIFYVRAYTTKGSARTGWNLIMLGHLFGVLFLASAVSNGWSYLVTYLIGVGAAYGIGHICLWYLRVKHEPDVLRDYHGSIYAFAKLGNLFFIVSLIFMVFPISPAFLAQDIVVSSIPVNHAFLMVFFCFSYLLVGVGAIRLYTKVFFGPHKTSHHEIAYRSS